MSSFADPIPRSLAEQTPQATNGDLSFVVQLLNAVQHSIIAVDQSNAITYWNDYAERLYGFSRQEAMGRSIYDLTVQPENQEAARAIMDTVWAGQAWTGEHPVLHRNGSFIHARVRLFPIYNSHREVTGIIGVSEDISSEVAARDALQRTRDRFELFARSTYDAFWDWDLLTGDFWSNDAYNRLLGPRQPDFAPFDAFLERVHPDDRSRLRASMEAAFTSTELSFGSEYRLRDYSTGQYLRILDRGFFVRDSNDALLRVVGAMTDVTAVIDIERAYRVSEERFRLVFEESPLGIIIFREDLHIVQSNAAYRRMIDYTVDELACRSIVSIAHPDDQLSCIRLIEDLFTADLPAFRVEKRFNRRDGSIVWAAVTATLLPARGDTPAQGLALIEDITEGRRVRDELAAAKLRAEAAMNAKMRFLAQISHEIRSPMNGVLGMLELLDSSPLSGDQQDYVTAARQAATSLLGMLEEILDLTRLDQQRLALHLRPYSPSQLVQDVATLYRANALSRTVRLSATCTADVPTLHTADPARIRQILTNLLDNALKFTENGEVRLNLCVTHETLQFSVTDDGIGIPEDSLSSVFEPFSAISGQTSASVGGTGLGLAISQRLARLMGGDITVSSRLGEGSRFTLTLPLTTDGTIPSLAVPAPVEPTEFPGRRILVVEDNLINQRVAAGLLRRLRCKVDLAENGVEALQMALSSSYDAILMDAMMPIMDGFEATTELRRRESQGTRVPVIGLTALATVEDRQRCLAAGMDDFLPKPTNFHALASTLARWLPA